MSYSFRVKFADGQGTVTDISGTPPEAGVLSVSGHEDEHTVNVGVTLVDADGKQRIGAYATGSKS